MSGRRWCGATTCTAWLFTRTVVTRAAPWCPTPQLHPRAAPIPGTCGRGWKATRKKQAARCWPLRTMATWPMASCSQWKPRTTARTSTSVMSSVARAGNPSMRQPRSRATGRPTHCCHRMTNSPISRPGISATSTFLRPRRTTCSPESTPGKHSSAVCYWKKNSAPTPTNLA